MLSKYQKIYFCCKYWQQQIVRHTTNICVQKKGMKGYKFDWEIDNFMVFKPPKFNTISGVL